MSFSDRAALLAAITADPDEDTPRLGNRIGADGRRALIERFGPGVCVFEGGDR